MVSPPAAATVAIFAAEALRFIETSAVRGARTANVHARAVDAYCGGGSGGDDEDEDKGSLLARHVQRFGHSAIWHRADSGGAASGSGGGAIESVLRACFRLSWALPRALPGSSQRDGTKTLLISNQNFSSIVLF